MDNVYRCQPFLLVVTKLCLLFLVPVLLVAQPTIATNQYRQIPKKQISPGEKSLPNNVDLSMYTPTVIDQGNTGMCAAVASVYYMRTILEAQKQGITHFKAGKIDKAKIDRLRFSPAHLYTAVKSSADHECKLGIDIGVALEYLKRHRLPLFPAQGSLDCLSPKKPVGPETSWSWPGMLAGLAQSLTLSGDKTNAATSNTQHLPDSRILDYVRLYDLSTSAKIRIAATKKALSELSPVVVAVQLTSSIKGLTGWQKTWEQLTRQTNYKRWQAVKAKSLGYSHAMCVVGYNEKKKAFKLVNSWGEGFGDKGYFWVSYADYGRFAKFGYQAYLRTNAADTTSVDLTLLNPIDIQVGVDRSMATNGLAAYTVRAPQPTGSLFHFRAEASQGTYLYLISASANDSLVRKLVPYNGFHPYIGPNTQVNWPKNDLLELKGQPTLEYWLFLFSNAPIAIDEYILKINQQKGPFPERVTAAFGSVLVPPQQINYKPMKMGFFQTSQNASRITPLLVTMNHVD